MKDRNLYYNYGGYFPLPSQNTYLNTSQDYEQNYNINYINEINKRLDKIERQVKRLEQRITRIETPYISNNINEPDNNMYIM